VSALPIPRRKSRQPVTIVQGAEALRLLPAEDVLVDSEGMVGPTRRGVWIRWLTGW
jgi:hypothetical protein